MSKQKKEKIKKLGEIAMEAQRMEERANAIRVQAETEFWRIVAP